MYKFVGKNPILVLAIGAALIFLGWMLLPGEDQFVTNTPGWVGTSIIVFGIVVFLSVFFIWNKYRKQE